MLLAQVDTLRPPAAPRDTLAAPPDTAGVPTLPPDTLPVYPAVPPRELPAGPLPAGTRLVFDVDSLVFGDIQTLSDLLAHVPGVYVARAHFYGQAEPVLYGGRGGQGIEIYWDGVPYLPLGRDSILPDPARIPLGPLERVEVIVLPASLRVYLVPRQARSTQPLTEIGIATGQAGYATYRGAFARRWRSGLGLTLQADFGAIDGFGGSPTTRFRSADLWARFDYVPSPRYGASIHVLSSGWKRDAGTSGDDRDVRRTDRIIRVFFRGRDDALGPQLQATVAASTINADAALAPDSAAGRVPAGRGVFQTIISAGWTWRRASVVARANLGVNRIPYGYDFAAAWSPLPPLTLAGDARAAIYPGGRTGRRAHLAAGLALPLGFSLRGDWSAARDLQAPPVLSDTAQQTTDLRYALRWELPWLTLEGGGARRDPFVPLGFASDVGVVAGLGPTPRTDYITAAASLRPLPGLTLSGWYFHPVGGGADFEPPQHARYSATFYSKFWRKYRSGVFALRAEVAAESWSAAGGGLGGRDAGGAQLPLQGGTFVDTNLEVQLLGFTLYWVVRNVNLMKTGYVADLPLRRAIQFYGARWSFQN